MKKDVEAMNATLDKIENVLLKDNKFLTGDEANIADVMAVSEVSVFQLKIHQEKLTLPSTMKVGSNRFFPVLLIFFDIFIQYNINFPYIRYSPSKRYGYLGRFQNGRQFVPHKNKI